MTRIERRLARLERVAGTETYSRVVVTATMDDAQKALIKEGLEPKATDILIIATGVPGDVSIQNGRHWKLNRRA